MNIKLKRFSFFLDVKTYKTVLIIVISLLLAYVVALIVNFANVISSFCLITVLCAAYLITSAFFQMREMPSCMHVGNGVISYAVWKSGIGSKISLIRSSRITYTVSDFTKFELKQTKVEKKLDIGHIEFLGKTNWDADENIEEIEGNKIHRIYGIPNFKKFSQEIFDNIHIKSGKMDKA